MHPPRGKLKHQRRQITHQNFRLVMGRKGPRFSFRPKPVANTRTQAARAAPALIRRSKAHPHRFQACHAAGRIKARGSLEARVNHRADAFNGQACFGNGGGQHDFP